MQRIIFATGNEAKLAQIRFVVEHCTFPVNVVAGREVFGADAAYEEVGDTVEDVARNGALAVARRIGAPIMTEDTDFRVEALNGEPGIRAGEFLKRFGRSEILRRMKGVANRKAVINSAIAYATPQGACQVFQNSVQGVIAQEERFGDFPHWIAPSPAQPLGGGYNAIFIPNGWNKTLAEIGPAEAISRSYREKNFVDAIRFILNRS